MVDPIQLPIPTPPPNADAHARADTERNRRLFDWAEAVLKTLGLDKEVAAARSIEDLRRIALDVNSAEIALALRDALHPTSGQRQEHFRGLKESGLKLVLKNRFADLKKAREATLRRGKPPDWADGLVLNKNGEVVPNLANLILILEEAPKWKGVLAYNEFKACVVIRKRPPWVDEPLDSPWVDHHDSLCRVWFQRDAGINPAAGDVGRAVQAAAKHNSFHPVRDYFEARAWDGTPRLDTWPIDYLHAEDSPYIRAIGPRYLISSVARIYQPGAKVDHMLVLEGPQGKLKSEALRTLAVRDDWFTDRLSHVASKDAILDTAGALIIEIAEMAALTKAAPSAVKAFITRRTDKFRPPYGKHPINLKRQNVFAGTINPPTEGYLRDPTGARRFWPIVCNGMIDLAGLEAVRDQLWAEAVHRFKAGAKWHLETPELEALATAEQEVRFVVDAWEEPIREWLGDRTDVSVAEVLQHVFGIAKEQSQSAQTRVARILAHRLGFTKHRPGHKERKNRYWREPFPKKR
jgi:putative DNA primase/helicase